ncbi:HAD family hydrolase [Lacibacterium aquatile]|uniref:HAD family hydrolase n=1 Tax=Lacibacterium aquatile TaxID=1168082 RepID=A0ABW5DVV0_9PROT
MGIEAVLFDLGNVLIKWDPETPYRTLIPDATERRRFLDEVCTLAWHAPSDEGRPWAEMIAEKIAEFPQHEPLIRAWRERFHEMVVGPIEGTVALLEQMNDRQVPLFALTNWAADTFIEARPRFAFLERFRHITVSGELGMMKPDPKIFLHALGHIALPAEKVLFIDDSATNIASAKALGFACHHFQAPEALAADLKARGLLG